MNEWMKGTEWNGLEQSEMQIAATRKNTGRNGEKKKEKRVNKMITQMGKQSSMER